MLKRLTLVLGVGLLAGCIEAPAPTQPPKPEAEQTAQLQIPRHLEAKVKMVDRTLQKVAPVSYNICMQNRGRKPERFCDFQYFVDDDPQQPPNAFQTRDKSQRPVIVFNINMIAKLRNEHEVAYILGHEAGHQIAQHQERHTRGILIGAVIGGVLAGATGSSAIDGAFSGANDAYFSYSQGHELEADEIGTHIAYLAGYDPRIGVKSIAGAIVGSNPRFSTHPPSPDRIRVVNETYKKILANR
jgi:hypothetical protein